MFEVAAHLLNAPPRLVARVRVEAAHTHLGPGPRAPRPVGFRVWGLACRVQGVGFRVSHKVDSDQLFVNKELSL